VIVGFEAVIQVVLGLELIETLQIYYATHRVRLQVILVVALIAVSRHVMVLDVEHVEPMQIGGAAVLILALAAGYYLVGLVDSRAPQATDRK
jgi:uncharacterized membrane protein (DUF373 family)